MIANPPPWPGGARWAVALSFDVDTDRMLHYTLANSAHKSLWALSWTRYDEVAIPPILALYKNSRVHQTFFLPAWVAEPSPRCVEAFVSGGHQVPLHGYVHELSNTP